MIEFPPLDWGAQLLTILPLSDAASKISTDASSAALRGARTGRVHDDGRPPVNPAAGGVHAKKRAPMTVAEETHDRCREGMVHGRVQCVVGVSNQRANEL